MTRIRLLTVAWGDEFIGRLLDVTFRSLAAPGNLNDIASHFDVAYELVVPEDSVGRIKAHPSFAELSRGVSFRFRPFSLDAIDSNNSMSHWSLWQRAVADARRDDVCVVLVAADHIFARGALARWVQLLDEGYLAVFSPGFQVVDETAMAELAARFPDTTAIDLAPAEMQAFMLRHLHPLKISMLRGSLRVMVHREWDLRSIPGKGISQTVLAAHPMAFRPARIRLSDNFSPLEKLDRVAFEPCWFLGVEPLFKFIGQFMRPQPMNDAMLSCYGSWADAFIRPVNQREAAVSHPYVYGALATDRECRDNRIGSEFFLRQLLTSRTLYQLWRSLRMSGHPLAAQWLATAMVHGRLRRQIAVRAPLMVAVPAESVLERLTSAQQGRLLTGRGEALIAAIKDLAMVGGPPLQRGQRLAEASDGTLVSASGQRFAVVPHGGVRVTAVLPTVDGITICVVDGLLSPLDLDAPQGVAARDVRRWIRHAAERLTRRAKNIVLAITARHQGLYLYVVNARQRMLDRERPSEAIAVDDEAVLLLRRALAARALAGLDDLFGFYEDAVFSGTAHSHAMGARLTGMARPDITEVRRWLAEAVARAPHFFEAWFARGYASLDGGDEADALAAFARAKDLQPTQPPAPGQPNPRFQALIEWASLAAKTNPAAVPGLASVSAGLPWGWHVRHARLLLAAGRGGEARAAFERALPWAPIESRFTGYLPRDLDEAETLLRAGR